MKTQIHLPNDLLAAAGAHWIRAGHYSLQGYIIHLIRQDLNQDSTRDSRSLARRVGKGEGIPDPASPPMAIRRNSQRNVAREPVGKIRKRLLDGMTSYMKATEDPGYGYACGYQLKHIDRCAAIVDAFLAELSAASRAKPQIVFKAVERAVLKLNKLNSSCGGALIETDQREDLCKLMMTAVSRKGVEVDGDITEAWREW